MTCSSSSSINSNSIVYKYCVVVVYSEYKVYNIGKRVCVFLYRFCYYFFFLEFYLIALFHGCLSSPTIVHFFAVSATLLQTHKQNRPIRIMYNNISVNPDLPECTAHVIRECTILTQS